MVFRVILCMGMNIQTQQTYLKDLKTGHYGRVAHNSVSGTGAHLSKFIRLSLFVVIGFICVTSGDY